MNLALLCSDPPHSGPTNPLPPRNIPWSPPALPTVGNPQRHPPPPSTVPNQISATPASSPKNACLAPFSPPIDGPSGHTHIPPRYPQQLQYFQELPSEHAGYSEMSMMHPNERHRWIAPQYKPDQNTYPSYANRHLLDRSVHSTNSAGQAQSIYPYYGSYSTQQTQYSYAQYDTSVRNSSFRQQAYPPGVPPPLPTPVTPSDGNTYPNTNEVPSQTTFLQADLEKVADNCAIISRFAVDHLEAMRSHHGSQSLLPPELMREMCGRAYDVLRTLLSVGGPVVDPRSLIPGAAKAGEVDPGEVGSENGESHRDVYSELKPRCKYRKRNKRTAPPAPGRCHSCNISETPEWRRGPDGARTLCNACGLHFAKLTRKRALADQKSAELKRLERSIEQVPTSFIDVSSAQSDVARNGNTASSSSMPLSPHENSIKRPRLEGRDASFVSEPPQYPDNHNPAEGSKNGIGVLPSVSDVQIDLSVSIVASSTSEKKEASISRDND